jgi:biopolymer transport protein TolR
MKYEIHRAPSSTLTSLAEINVTPLVDVMLVLLIIFMISAPLMQQGISIQLPKATAEAISETPEQITLQINAKHQILIADHLIEPGTLFQKLTAILAAKPQTEVIVQADDQVSYGLVAQAMAEVKRAGIQRVSLATDPNPSKNPI